MSKLKVNKRWILNKFRVKDDEDENFSFAKGLPWCGEVNMD